MRRVLFLLAFIMVSLSVYSRKEIVLKSGTLIPVQSVNTVRATDVKIGQLIPFRVARDVNVNGVTAIPYVRLSMLGLIMPNVLRGGALKGDSD